MHSCLFEQHPEVFTVILSASEGSLQQGFFTTFRMTGRNTIVHTVAGIGTQSGRNSHIAVAGKSLTIKDLA